MYTSDPVPCTLDILILFVNFTDVPGYAEAADELEDVEIVAFLGRLTLTHAVVDGLLTLAYEVLLLIVMVLQYLLTFVPVGIVNVNGLDKLPSVYFLDVLLTVEPETLTVPRALAGVDVSVIV